MITYPELKRVFLLLIQHTVFIRLLLVTLFTLPQQLRRNTNECGKFILMVTVVFIFTVLCVYTCPSKHEIRRRFTSPESGGERRVEEGGSS